MGPFYLTHTNHLQAHKVCVLSCIFNKKYLVVWCFSWLLISITCNNLQHKEVQNLGMFCNLLSCYCMNLFFPSLGACPSYLPKRTWGIKTKTPKSYGTIQYKLTLVTTLLLTSPPLKVHFCHLSPFFDNKFMWTLNLVSIFHLSQLFGPHNIGKENVWL